MEKDQWTSRNIPGTEYPTERMERGGVVVEREFPGANPEEPPRRVVVTSINPGWLIRFERISENRCYVSSTEVQLTEAAFYNLQLAIHEILTAAESDKKEKQEKEKNND